MLRTRVPWHARKPWTVASALISSCLWSHLAFAVPPVVYTVPSDPNNALARHDLISGRPTTLKGSADASCAGVCTWEWNPGDGSPVIMGDVDADPISPADLDDLGYNPHWALWAEHTYTGNVGDVFIATLTVDNGVDAPVSAQYRSEIRADTISNEVNAAIDEALWFMHRNQFRFDGTETGQTGGAIPMGRWDYANTFGNATPSVAGATVNAFEANGYLESGPVSSPYSETVARGLAYIFSQLEANVIDIQTQGDLSGQGRMDDPDTDGNGIGITTISFDEPYQNGMLMDAIIASGTPGAIAVAGAPDVIGRTYQEIIQDMVDWYAWAQSDNVDHGGWQYGPYDDSPFDSHDNSASGWAAIGLVAAEDLFGATIPDFVKERNENGLEFTDNEGDADDRDGIHGYSSDFEIWGPYGVTGAAMVQMVMDNLESTTSATPDERWIRSENYFRRHFNDDATGNNLKNYYYGMFNFAKSMRSADPSPVIDIGTEPGAADGGVGCGPQPACAAGGAAPLDWYNHPTDGLARTVVDYQILPGDPNTEGECGAAQPGPCPNIGAFTDRPGNSHGSSQDDHNTPWATQILTRTLFQAGPIARAEARPNPTAENVDVEFDPSESFHQDPARSIVLYEWDFDDDGVFDTSTVAPDPVTNAFVCPPPGLPCSFPVTLRVTDDANPAQTANDVVIVDITIPPHPPTAVSGGPYTLCLGEVQTLDGSGSFDINEGTSETGNPPFDTITLYEWDFDLASGPAFDMVDDTGPMPTFDTSMLITRDIALRVTDNTAAAFPGAMSPDLTDTDSTTLEVIDCLIADLSITASADPATVAPGEQSTVTLVVGNGGPEDATGVTVDVTLPAGLSFDSVTPEQGMCTVNGGVSCDVGDLASGMTIMIDVVVTADEVGDFTVDATVSSDAVDLDPDPSNNSDSADISAVVTGDADMELTASTASITVDEGDDLSFTFTVTNNGPDDATGVDFSASFPGMLSGVSGTPDQGSCAVNGTLDCDLGDIASGASVDIEFSATAESTGTGSVDGSVDADQTDPDPSNNDASVDLTIEEALLTLFRALGKGGGAAGPLELLLLLLAVAGALALRRRQARGAGAVLAAGAVASTLALAPGSANAVDPTWYVGASFGGSDANYPAEEFIAGMNARGFDVFDVSVDDTDSAWKVLGGIQLNSFFAVEGAWVDLGEVTSDFRGNVTDIQAAIDRARDIHVYMSDGFTLEAVGRVPIGGDRFSVFATAGLFFRGDADVEIRVIEGGNQVSGFEDSGTEATYGVGALLNVGSGWGIRAEWETYEVNDQTIQFISIGVQRAIGAP